VFTSAGSERPGSAVVRLGPDPLHRGRLVRVEKRFARLNRNLRLDGCGRERDAVLERQRRSNRDEAR